MVLLFLEVETEEEEEEKPWEEDKEFNGERAKF